MSIGTFNPYQAPEADLTGPADYLDPDQLRPVPFEDLETEPRFWPRLGAMFSILFKDPKGLADRIPVTRSLWAPWRFMLILGAPMMLFWCAILSLVFFAGALAESGASDAPPLWFLALIPMAFLAIFPLSQGMWMLFGGLVNHGLLWIWGGLRNGEDLNATIRATGYFFAFFTLVIWIPLVGAIAMLAGPAALGTGLARVHRTNLWRGICAAYTPLFLCCCLYGAFLLTMVGVASAGAFMK